MSDHSHIQWTDASWNFVTGCTKVSDGCIHCYIERTPPFRMSGRRFDKPGVGGATGVVLHEDRLTLPLKWRKPRRIFVNSLADLWHDEVPLEMIVRAFAVMVAAPHHTFQVLTKRHARMRSMLTSNAFWASVSDELGRLWDSKPPERLRAVPPWIWLGVSVENQQWAGPRIDALRAVPAAVRWLSAEPLLGELADLDLTGIAWVVGGGESGPGARPCDLDWLRGIRDDCSASGVAFFCKQLGSVWAKTNGADPKGGDWSRWPADLRLHTGDQMFPSSELEGAGLRAAKRTCNGCPVWTECLDEALGSHTWGRHIDIEGQGVRAGLSTTERRAHLDGAPIAVCQRCNLLYANHYQVGTCHPCTPPELRRRPRRSRVLAGAA